MSRARYGFTAHPDALQDLRRLPDRILDLALLQLQHLVRGHERGAPLHGRLSGCFKVYVDPAAEWRFVFQYRVAPKSSPYSRDLYLIAAGPRQDSAVYHSARQRLNRAHQPADSADVSPDSERSRAARARSPHAPGDEAPPPGSPAGSRSSLNQPSRDHTRGRP